MKRMYKYAGGLFLSCLLSVLMISTASAQRGARSGGGGGASAHFGGGGIGFHNSVGARSGINGQVAANFHRRVAYRAGRVYFSGVGYHGGAFSRPGFGYYGSPHFGFYCGILPYGYYPFYWGAGLYYYYDGIFYTPYDNGGYQVTAPPIGAGVPNLPRNANPIKIDGVQYYESDGVYYKESVDDKGKKIYVVAGRDGVLNTGDNVTDPNATVTAPKIGDMVNQLPDDCRKVNLNGKKYFVSPDGIYYEKVTDPSGNVAYRIASLPSDDDKGI
jgi:hypothetical protein